MIDDKFLVDLAVSEECSYDELEFQEMIRLARLGLWAEDSAIPALKRIAKNFCDCSGGAGLAIKELPELSTSTGKADNSNACPPNGGKA